MNSLQDFAAYRVPADSFIYNSFRLPLFNGILKNTAGNEWSNSITIRFKDEKQKHQLTFSNFQQKTGLFIGAFGIPRSYNLLPAENNRKIDLPYQKVQHYKLISNHQWRNDYGLFKVDVGFQSNIRHEMAKPHAHNGITPISNTSLLLELRTLTANMLHTKYFHPFTIQSGGQFQFQTNKAQGHEFLIPNYEQSQWGIFSLIKSNFKSNLQASAGVRWDMISQNIKEGILLWHDESGIEIYQEKRSNALKRKYHNLSTGIGLAYKFSTQTHINFNIGSAFRTPSISELSSNGIHHGTFRHEMGNENLLHEKGWLYDLQIHHKIKNGYIELSPFYNHFGNYIYLKPSGQFSPLPEAGQIYHYVNAPVTFYGAELLVHQHLLKYWQYNIIAEYVWNENRSTKNPLPFTPPLNLLTEVIFQPITNSKKFFWKASANAHFFAAQNRTDLNEPKTESYLLSNVSLDGHWMLGKNKLSIFLQIKNLFNEHYYNNMSRYRILNLPEQGINFQLLMRYQF